MAASGPEEREIAGRKTRESSDGPAPRGSGPHRDGHGNWKRRLRSAERRVVSVLRSPAARWLGFALGLAAFGLFIVTFIRSGSRATDLISGRPLLTMAPALIGVLLFEATAILTLDRVGANASTTVWAASQLAKYLPVPASAAAGMLGSSVRAGHSARSAFKILVSHSILLVGSATTVGSLAAGVVAGAGDPWPPNWLSVSVFTAGAVVMASVLRPLHGRTVAGSGALAGWVAVATGMGLSFAPPGDAGAALLLGSAYCAAWVAGQIVVPVPAGLGVREAALVALLAPTIGSTAALGFAVLSRLIHVLADGVLAVAVFVVRPLFRTRTDSEP